MIIYLVKNNLNDKCYVGQTTTDLTKRWIAHCSKGHYLHNAILKYGSNSFDVSVIDTAANLEDLNRKEIEWISKLNTIAPNGYNLRLGGLSGGKHSIGTKLKISQAGKGRIHSYSWKQKMSKRMSGMNNPMYGKSPNWGKKLLEKTKNKIRVANLGQKRTLGTCIKIGLSKLGSTCWRKGKKFGYENNRKNQRSFLVYEKKTNFFIGEWTNQRVCADTLGINFKGLNLCLHDRKPSYKGYKFIFKKE
jgi:group I intron endonuclease